MASILKSFIPYLIARCDLADVIDARVPLKKQGKNYVACCPFHQENTPSFTVTPEKQFYYCFGCNSSGNVISFVMAYDRLNFVEAVECLAAHYKLIIPYEENARHPIAKKESANLYTLLEQAVQFYQKQLHETPEAQAYLEKRGLSKTLIQEFRLGYAPPGWQNIYSYLHRVVHYTPASLQAVGLITTKATGKEYYDRFRERIIFPIRDRRGRYIGFGGRTLKTEITPKYLNSPETDLFRKSYELYGLYEAIQQPSTKTRIWVVEGYMDVLSLVQHEIKNVVATLGTATSRAHIQRLFSITQEVIFCFDGDAAGNAAAWRALETSLPIFQDGWSIRFLILPKGEDPDSIVQKDQNGLDYKKSESFGDFFFRALSRDIELNTSTGKAKLAKQALKLLKLMPNSVTQQHLFERLARLVDVELTTLSRLAAEKKPVTQQNLSSKSPLKLSYSPLDRAMASLLRMPQWAAQFSNELDLFTIAPYLQLKDLSQFIQQTPQASSGMLIEYFRDKIKIYERIKPLLYNAPIISDAIAVQEFQDIIMHLQKLERDQKIENLMQKAKLHPLSEEEERVLYSLMKVSKKYK